MKLKKLVILLIVFLTTVSLAQEKNQHTYGFASFNVPIDSIGERYTFNWARIGLQTSLNSNMRAVLEYDISQSASKLAYLQFTLKNPEYTTSLLAGQFYNPIAHLYHDRLTMPMTRWPYTLNDFSIYSTGLCVWYEQGRWMFRAAQYNSGAACAALSYGRQSIFWDKDVGYGGMFTVLIPSWLNMVTGITIYNDRDIKDPVYFARYSMPVLKWLFEDIKVQYSYQLEYDDNEYYYLFGFTWEYTENCLIKLFFDGSFAEKNSHAKLELTFAFD